MGKDVADHSVPLAQMPSPWASEVASVSVMSLGFATIHSHRVVFSASAGSAVSLRCVHRLVSQRVKVAVSAFVVVSTSVSVVHPV